MIDLRLSGTAQDTGGAGFDTLIGIENVMGGADRDRMRGGEGADIFRLEALSDNGVGWRRDVIADFDGDAGDRIDLSLLGRMTGFGGGGCELRYRHEGGLTIVMGDVDGDAVADFEIELVGPIALESRDFLF